MRKFILLGVFGLLISLVWINLFAISITPGNENLGREVGGIQVSLRPTKARFVSGEPIVVDLQITNIAQAGSGRGYEIYIPWRLGRPSNLYEIHAVDEKGNKQIICGGMGIGGGLEVLCLPPATFCGYRLTCGSKGFSGSKNLQPGKYQLYAVFKNSHPKLPGPYANVIVHTEEQRRELKERVSRQREYFEKENEKLKGSRLWMGQAYSESVSIEVVPR